jgi:hypothetical protein
VNFKDKDGAENEVREDSKFVGKQDEFDEALKDFRLSVHAWSEAAYLRPRKVPARFPHWSAGRLAVGWALGCVLVIGGASTGVWEHHQREAKSAAVRVAEQERLASQQRNQQAREEKEGQLAKADSAENLLVKADSEADLLAKVDSDVSRAVPAAMEPLAQLMVEDKTP